MNLITNCCLGAFVYEQLNKEFNNPFMWCAINTDSFIYLLEHYDKTNFNDVEFDRYTREDGVRCYSLIIENNCRLNYTHYLQGGINDHEKIIGKDIYDYRAYEYCFNKYKTRLARMLENKEPPVFVVLGELVGKYDYNLENLKRICEAKTSHKLLIITSFEELKQYENDRIKIIIDKHPKNEKGCFTEHYAKLYAETIYNFLS